MRTICSVGFPVCHNKFQLQLISTENSSSGKASSLRRQTDKEKAAKKAVSSDFCETYMLAQVLHRYHHDQVNHQQQLFEWRWGCCWGTPCHFFIGSDFFGYWQDLWNIQQTVKSVRTRLISFRSQGKLVIDKDRINGQNTWVDSNTMIELADLQSVFESCCLTETRQSPWLVALAVWMN